MEEKKDFLESSRALRKALIARATEIEKNVENTSNPSLLETQIQKNIQSSLQFYKTNPNKSQNNSASLRSLMELKIISKSSRNLRKTPQDPLKLPSVRKIYLPYLKKPLDLPLPVFKKVKRYKVDFTGIEPKVKKLNLAYSLLN